MLAFSHWLPGPLYQEQSKLHHNSPANYKKIQQVLLTLKNHHELSSSPLP